MNMKKKVMRRLAALLITSLTLTSSAFSVLADTGRTDSEEIVYYDLVEPDEGTLTLNVGDTEMLTVKVATDSNASSRGKATSSDALKNNLKWTSSNDSVIEVEAVQLTTNPTNPTEFSCKVEAIGVGNAKVTVISEGTTEDNQKFKSSKIEFKITVATSTTKPTIKLEDLSVKVGEAAEIKTTVTGAEASKIEWTSSNNTIVTVKDGKITGVKAGEAIITAKVGDVTATCKVTVTAATSTTKPTIKLEDLSVKVGETAEIKTTVTGAEVSEIEWTSSNNTIVTVKDGKVYGAAEGMATITAKVGDVTATCKVTIFETKAKPVEVEKDKIPEEFKNNQDALNSINNQTDNIQSALDNVSAAVVQEIQENTEVQNTIDEIANEIESVPKGSKLKVGDIDSILKVEKDKDGNPIVVVEELSYDIHLINPTGEKISHEDLEGNTKEIKIDIPLPAKGIKPEWKFATIKHYKDEKRETLLNTLYSKIFGDEKRHITIKTKSFSPFVMTFSETDPEPKKDTSSGNNSGSRRSGSSGGAGGNTSGSRYAMTGTWSADANGWKFTKSNGETAANTWGFINNQYYYFDASGKMVTGWMLVDGCWYYLSPAENLQGAMMTGVIFDPAYDAYFYADASGAMVTGWYQVGEKWYYFSPISDGVHVQGQLLTGTYIDGYYVGADGAWISAN